MSDRPLRIAVSFAFQWADPERALFKGKTLAYIEESMLRWPMEAGLIPCLLPRSHGPWELRDILEHVDGLLLSGGTDIAPQWYGETPINDDRRGDKERDHYELAAFRAARDLGLPILGVCRGLQLINVALGGSLWQDVHLQLEDSLVHRNWEIYDENKHPISIEPGTPLEKLYPEPGEVNSVHSQAIKRLADGLTIEARAPDGIIEAVSLINEDSYIRGIQWHPEFHSQVEADLLDPDLLLEDWIRAMRRKQKGG